MIACVLNHVQENIDALSVFSLLHRTSSGINNNTDIVQACHGAVLSCGLVRFGAVSPNAIRTAWGFLQHTAPYRSAGLWHFEMIAEPHPWLRLFKFEQFKQ